MKLSYNKTDDNKKIYFIKSIDDKKIIKSKALKNEKEVKYFRTKFLWKELICLKPRELFNHLNIGETIKSFHETPFSFLNKVKRLIILKLL